MCVCACVGVCVVCVVSSDKLNCVCVCGCATLDSCLSFPSPDPLTVPPTHLLLQVHFLMILSANWAYLKDASHMHAYQDIKLKEEQELLDITSRSKECLNTYT